MGSRKEDTTDNRFDGEATNATQSRDINGVVTYGGSVTITGSAVGSNTTVTNYGTDKDDR